MTQNGDEIIILDGVYKIFGPQPGGRAFDLLRSGMSKDEVQAETGHVVGLDDVTFTVHKGEVFVVMGLSGSGKSTAMRTVNKLIDITAGSISLFT
ncbi:MAG: ATP-binding cassette domain-containing protein, partial [Acidimicrobiia bacterium]|nr:ATP-binding cassette domain-containing protein [Acidimicrobiia bacterium]